MIEGTHIRVTIGKTELLHGIDFSAQTGAFSVIVGPNGSGKTTLMKALSKDLAYEGSITLHGEELRNISSTRAAEMRAVLPQSSVLSFPFTVREVVALGLTGGRPGVPVRDYQTLPERALDAVDLDGFAGRYYQDLSGGEQQRVQLARVLCQVWVPVLDDMPRFLFLDEPVSSLDIRHQLMILNVARDFANRGGGVIAILHDLNLTAMFADQVSVLKSGRCIGTGSAEEVIEDGLIRRAFECDLSVGAVPQHVPFVLPQSAAL